MNFQDIVKEILSTGMSEKELADAMGTTQPTINRIKRGVHKTPVYDVAKQLEALHEKLCKKAA